VEERLQPVVVAQRVEEQTDPQTTRQQRLDAIERRNAEKRRQMMAQQSNSEQESSQPEPSSKTD